MTSEPAKPFPQHLRMPPTPVLTTERLILRPPRQTDTPALQRRFPQWEVVRYLHAEVPWPYPEDGAATNMTQTLEQLARGEKSCLSIVLKGGPDEPIGRIDLWADDGEKRDQRGFWLDPDYWGKGVMTEAANQVTDYALVELGWPHLWLSNAEINRGSHRVKEKQGATIIERTARAYVYGEGVKVTWLLTRDAWLAHRTGRQP